MPGTTDPLRERMHGLWQAVAPGWGEHADYVDERSGALTGELLDRARLTTGDRVLELACGPGGLGLAAARRVAPGGAVVLSDVAPAMVEIARRRAEGLPAVEARVLDLEDIAEPDAAYDAVLCREGLMFAADPARAAGEIARVLRPGGRVALAVWGPREQNPWLGLVLDAVSEQVGFPVPPPGVPGPFALSDAERLGSLLAGAGFEDVDVHASPVPARAASFTEYWERTRALAGPLAQILAGMPAEAQAAIGDRLETATEQYRTADGIALPGVTLVASGRRG
jgi:SAM-dependent methyltransferase